MPTQTTRSSTAIETPTVAISWNISDMASGPSFAAVRNGGVLYGKEERTPERHLDEPRQPCNEWVPVRGPEGLVGGPGRNCAGEGDCEASHIFFLLSPSSDDAAIIA